jgi:hypothetical protein
MSVHTYSTTYINLHTCVWHVYEPIVSTLWPLAETVWSWSRSWTATVWLWSQSWTVTVWSWSRCYIPDITRSNSYAYTHIHKQAYIYIHVCIYIYIFILIHMAHIQAVEAATLIPLQHGIKRCILVGDPRQLPATVISQEPGSELYQRSLFQRLQVSMSCVYVCISDIYTCVYPC